MNQTTAVSYPANITLGGNYGVAQPKEVPGIISSADNRIREFGRTILIDQPEIRRYPPCLPQIFRLISLPYRWFFRRYIGKMFVADSQCNSCGICINACPVHAIRLFKGRPRWNYNCEGCHKCINICPRKAIEGSILRVIAQISVIAAPYATIIQPLIISMTLKPPFIGIFWLLILFGFWLMISVVLFGLFDIGLAALERPPLEWRGALIGYTKGTNRYNIQDYESNIEKT